MTVTVDEFRRLRPAHVNPVVFHLDPNEPITYVSWFDAAIYCNRLSQQEGIPPDQWCYEMDENEQITKLRPNYLSLTGYRLPTEAELEYATRANATTNRFYRLVTP